MTLVMWREVTWEPLEECYLKLEFYKCGLLSM